MEQKLALVNWSRGKYSEVFRSAIIDPSPIKAGQQVKVIWGKTKKEYSAVVSCYPVAVQPEYSKPDQNAKLGPRKAKTKRKLMPDYEYEGTNMEVTKKVAKKATTKDKDNKKKEKPKGKILDVESPTKGHCVIGSSDSSDSDTSDAIPLVAVTPVRSKRRDNSSPPVSPPPNNLDDFSDEEVLPIAGEMTQMIRKAITTVEKTNRVCRTDETSELTSELRLTRTILERLECSFARQEAKLDRLLGIMESTRTNPPQPAHSLSAIQQFSTPTPTNGPSQSMEFPPPVVFHGTPLSDVERLLDNPDLTGTSDLVPVGGSINVRLPRSEYDHIQASSKPSSMVLRLLDKLFTKETLLKSTLYGTKEFAALDSTKIAAIKAEVTRAFSYQCRTAEEVSRMWEQCKVSIGKKCQHLRRNEKQNRQD